MANITKKEIINQKLFQNLMNKEKELNLDYLKHSCLVHLMIKKKNIVINAMEEKKFETGSTIIK